MKLDFFPARLTNDRLVFVVKIEDGWGEIAPLEMDGGKWQEIKETLVKLQQELKPMAWGELKTDIFTGLSPSVSYGLEQALLHHQANRENKTLAKLLAINEEPAKNLTINALIPRVSAPEAAKMTDSFIEQGYQSIKIKVGSPHIQDDIDRVEAVRKRSSKITIHLDANGRWTKDNVLHNLSLLSEYTIDYVEQPLKTLAELAWLQEYSPIPLAVDEAATSLPQLKEAIDRGCCQFVVIKPMVWGGLKLAQSAIEYAIDRGMVVILTGTLEGPVGRWGTYELGRASAIHRPCGLTGFDYTLTIENMPY